MYKIVCVGKINLKSMLFLAEPESWTIAQEKITQKIYISLVHCTDTFLKFNNCITKYKAMHKLSKTRVPKKISQKRKGQNWNTVWICFQSHLFRVSPYYPFDIRQYLWISSKYRFPKINFKRYVLSDLLEVFTCASKKKVFCFSEIFFFLCDYHTILMRWK